MSPRSLGSVLVDRMASFRSVDRTVPSSVVAPVSSNNADEVMKEARRCLSERLFQLVVFSHIHFFLFFFSGYVFLFIFRLFFYLILPPFCPSAPGSHECFDRRSLMDRSCGCAATRVKLFLFVRLFFCFVVALYFCFDFLGKYYCIMSRLKSHRQDASCPAHRPNDSPFCFGSSLRVCVCVRVVR